MPAKKADSDDFESQLAELEALVEAMEQGQMSLEDSLKAFEQGVKLTRACQKRLESADQKVSILLQDQEDQLQEFPTEEK